MKITQPMSNVKFILHSSFYILHLVFILHLSAATINPCFRFSDVHVSLKLPAW